ncbi:MAG: chloride channel protein [Calditrichia bacterium]
MNLKRLSQISHYKFIRFFSNRNLPEDYYLYFLAALVGVLAGFGAVALTKMVHLFQTLFFGELLSVVSQNGILYYIVKIGIPAIGGLLVGLVIYFFSRESAGHGVPGVIEAISDKEGIIKPKVSIITILTSGTLIGTGGSAGKEGPIIQIGAALGSAVGQFFRVSANRLKILVGAGAGAGLAAVFNAPVTGVLFVLEVLLRDFSINAFSPIIVATVIATTISHYFIGSTPLYEVPSYHLNDPREYFFYAVIGILGGLLSVFFIKFFYKFEDVFEQLKRVPSYLKPAIGGLIVGVLALKFPQIYGWDDSGIHSAITQQNSVLFLLVIFMVKMIATSSSLGSGGTGGLFTPSLFLGATFGAAMGVLLNKLFPGVPAHPGAYALVGMGIMIAGTTHAALSAMILIFEITRDYAIILPLMLGIMTATIASRKFEMENIYTFKLSLKNELYLRGRRKDILEQIYVTSIIRKEFEQILVNERLKEIWNKVKHGTFDTFPVVDKQGHLKGLLTFKDIKHALFEDALDELVIAADIVNENAFYISEMATAYDALNIFDITDYDILPVVSSRQNKKLVGIVCKKDIEKLYREKYLEKL